MIHNLPQIDKIKIQTIFHIENYHTLTVDLFFFSWKDWLHYPLKIVFFSFFFFFFFFCLHAFCQQIGWLILSSACLNFVPEYSDSFSYRPGNARKSLAFLRYHRCISTEMFTSTFGINFSWFNWSKYKNILF